MRSLLSYYFTQKYGERQSAYLSPKNYANNPNQESNLNRLIDTFNSLAQSADYPYINHQIETYGNVPLWTLINGVTFGALSKFYFFLTQDLKTSVSKHFEKVNERQLAQYLKVITKFRNVCVHGERLFCYKTCNDIPNTVAHTKLQIPIRGEQFIYGKRDLFAVVIALKYLLSIENFYKFAQKLSKIIEQYLNSTSAISKTDLFEFMGFPLNWYEIADYKKSDI